MDYAACNIIYVDRTADEDTLIKREDVPLKLQDSNGSAPAQNRRLGGGKVRDVDCNVQTLLGTFSEVHVCTTGSSCISKLTELNEASSVDLIPTLVLVDIPYEDHLDESKGPSVRTPSPMTSRVEDLGPDEVDEAFYGLGLLRWIALEIQQHNLSKLVVPVALVTIPNKNQAHPRSHELIPEVSRSDALKNHVANRLQFASVNMPLDQRRTMKYLDTGAVDVLTSPLLEERLPSLAIHAYRAHKESLKKHNDFLEVKRGRKRSWVGLDDQKPYAYLREAMVSGLMDGICRVGGDESPLSHVRLSVPVERREKIENAIGSWYFSAHEFTDDELLHAALLILQHALDMPELEQWRVSTENLTGFLLACRGAYNAFVPYHNFRHVIDVLQAVFTFLIRIGTLPPYPIDSPPKSSPKSPIAQLLRPFDALTLLVTAIGHDVGHPGVNNAFLVTLNAPLAQLYNDRSVLESFHCAAYSQILRRHWPAAFQYVEMRQLMISSILATDMGLHFDYMKKLGFMQEKLHENGGTDGFNGRLLEEYRALACALLIKCADISNVARRYDVAAKWTMILTDEFARQASMEVELGIPSALFAPPVREIVELGQSQISFMNMFAIPLFQGVTDVMPAMQFCVDELHKNISIWAAKVEEEQKKAGEDPVTDGMFSPRAMSLANPSDAGSQQATNSPGTPIPKLDSSISGAQGNANKKSSRLKDISESDFQNASAKTSPTENAKETNGGIESEPLIPAVYSMAHRSGKPSPGHLQLSYATASAPGLLDHPSQAGHSLVTDAVVKDMPSPTAQSKPIDFQRTSDTTEGSNSVPGSRDWASQANSATTMGKLPLSPSTPGTSVMSDDSTERTSGVSPRLHTIDNPSRTLTNSTASQSCPAIPAASDHITGFTATTISADPSTEKQNGSGVTVMETMKSIVRKSSRSRFRMSFWKKKSGQGGLDVPPLPTGPMRASEEEMRGRSSGRS